MGKYVIYLILSCLLFSCNGGSSDIEKRLQVYIDGKDAQIGVATIIDGTLTSQVNGNEEFPMMSVFKLPLALAVAEWIDTSEFNLDSVYHISVEQLLEDTYSPMIEKYGVKPMDVTYRELLEWSLIESDNNACDILIDALGGTDSINSILTRMNLAEDIYIGATERDMYADHTKSYINRATPLGMARILENFDTKLRYRSMSFGEIGEMLERCRTGIDRIPAAVDMDSAVIGHKTGTGFRTSDGRRSAINDCGYIHFPDGRRCVIAVFIADFGYDDETTSQIIADITRLILEGIYNV